MLLFKCVGGVFVAFFSILVSVSLFRQTSAVKSRLCVKVSQCVSQRMLHSDTCLYVLITDVCFSGLLQTSYGSLPVSLPVASAAQVTQGGMTSMPHIHQTTSSSRRQRNELNLGSYYSEQADCLSYARIWWPLCFIRNLACLLIPWLHHLP